MVPSTDGIDDVVCAASPHRTPTLGPKKTRFSIGNSRQLSDPASEKLTVQRFIEKLRKQRVTSDLKTSHRIHAYELEPRVLFSASPIPVEMTEGIDMNEVGHELLEMSDLQAAEDANLAFGFQETDDDPFDGLAESFGGETTLKNEFVFVDDSVADHQWMSEQLQQEYPDANVVILDSSRNGIEQISNALAESQHVSAVHFISHGSEGNVQLGNTILNNQSLSVFTDQIVGWSHSLTIDADLYFYGCNLANHESGVELLESLEALTGADLAASDDLTGHQSLGGDWELEYRSGELEDLDISFSSLQQGWVSLLAADLAIDQFSINENETLSGNVLDNDSTGGYSLSATPIFNYDANLDSDGTDGWQDEEGTGLDLDLDPTITHTTDVTNGPNAVNGAYVFSGEGGDFSGIPEQAGVDPEGSAAFELWFNPTDGSGREVLFDIGNSTGTSLTLDGNQLEFFAQDVTSLIPYVEESVSTTYDLSSEISADEFIHFVGVLDASGSGVSMSMYINGVLVDTDANSDVVEWSNGFIDGTSLGDRYSFLAKDGSFGGYHGEISQFNIYDQVLTSSEISSNYDSAFLSIVGHDAVSSEGVAISVDAGGTFSYDPGNQFNYLGVGQSIVDTFRYTASDEFGSTSVQTVEITIQGVNDAPLSTSSGYTIYGSEDHVPLIFDLRTNVTDPDGGDSLDVANLVVASGDTVGVSFSDDGNVLTVDPDRYSYLDDGETEVLEFEYEVVDGNGGSIDRTLQVEISGINDAPEFSANASLSFSEDDSLQTIDLLDGFTDDESDVLNVTLIELLSGDDSGFSVAGNTLRLDPNAYNHLSQGDTETIVYRYQVGDGDELSSYRQISINVTGAGDAPTVSSAVTASANEDDADFVVNLLDGATDSDSDSLNVQDLTLVNGDASGMTIVGNTISVDPSAYGYLAVGESETISYEYNVTDLDGATPQTATITITGANDGPSVSDSRVVLVVNEDSPMATLDLLANASDNDRSDTLSVQNLVLQSGDASGVTIYGTTLEVDPDAYQSLADGEVMRVRYQYEVVDDHGAIAAQTAVVRIVGANDGPLVTSKVFAAVSEDDPGMTTVDLLASSFDIDATDSLTIQNVTRVVGDGSGITVVGTNLLVDPSAYQYLADGETESVEFEFEIVDESGAFITQHALVEITGANDLPVVTNYTQTIDEDSGQLTLDLFDNVIDVDHLDSLTIFNLSMQSGDSSGVTLAGDTIFVDSSLYDHLAEGESEVLRFSYDVIDAHGGLVADNWVEVTIIGVNDNPVVAEKLELFATEDQNLVVDLLQGATDVDSASLDIVLDGIVSGDFSGVTVSGTQLFVNPAAYQSLQQGEVENLVANYVIVDGDGGKVARTLALSIAGRNDAPVVAIPIDDVAVNEDSAVRVIDLEQAFADVDDDDLTFKIESVGKGGLIQSEIVDGKLIVRFAENRFGNTDIVVSATDARGLSSNTQFNIEVAPVNDAPVVADQSIAIVDDSGAATGNVMDNAYDVDSANLTAQLTKAPSNGTVVVNPDGTFTFTPSPGFSGTDSFEFVVSDGSAVSQAGEVIVTVGSFNSNKSEPAAVEVQPELEAEVDEQEVPETPVGQLETGKDNSSPKSTPSLVSPSTVQLVKSLDSEAEETPVEARTIAKDTGPTFSRSEATFYVRPTSGLELAEVTFSSLTTTTAALVPEATIHVISSLNTLGADLEQATDAVNLSLTTSVVSLSGVSIGVVTWTLRSGVLLASMMANLPAWRVVDPLSVLGYEDDDESLMDIVDGAGE